MSCIQTSVGLGNIWRFPIAAYENGGGAFLIPYVIVLFVIGKPMYYLEMFMGQFTSQSSVKIWEVNPAFRGNKAMQYPLENFYQPGSDLNGKSPRKFENLMI